MGTPTLLTHLRVGTKRWLSTPTLLTRGCGDIVPIHFERCGSAVAAATTPLVKSIVGNEAMDRTMRPEMRTGYAFVLHRIVTHIIEMAVKIVVVANRVFPEAPLPCAPRGCWRTRESDRHCSLPPDAASCLFVHATLSADAGRLEIPEHTMDNSLTFGLDHLYFDLVSCDSCD